MKTVFHSCSFFVFIISLAVMCAIYLFGDVHLSGFLWLHMIPEIVALYFFGVWVFVIKLLSIRNVVVVYLGSTFVVPSFFSLRFYLFGVVTGAFLGLAFLSGYFSARRVSARKRTGVWKILLGDWGDLR